MSLLPMLYARASAPKATVGDADAFVDAARTSGCAPSANETIDDVATMDLRCVLAQRLVGLAHARRVADDDGALAMRRACDAMERFLEDVTALECAPKSEREAIEAALGRDDDDDDEDERSGREEEASTSSNVKTATRFMSLGGMTRDARGDKLRRFKRRKEIRARVDAVRAAMARLDEEEEEDASDDETNRGNDEDELAREYWTLEIESAILDTLDELPTMRMEREMLERRDEIEETREIEERRRAAEDDRVGRAGAQNFTIERATAALTLDAAADHRSRFRDGVFKPSHILPTMTVEEFGEIERKEMLEREIQSARRAALRDAERAAKSTDEIEEEELRQAREWDDFKDDNPYGSGNSRLRPCS
jgi:immunoglobulin-binding protein 1